MSHRILLLLGLVAWAAVPAQADVLLHVDDVQVDWRSDLIDAGYVQLVGEPTAAISQLAPVPGWTGVKISDLEATWEITDSAPAMLDGLGVRFSGTASGTVVTDKVLIDWFDLHVTGPGLDDSNYNYTVWFIARYPELQGGQAEGQGGDANGNPNGSFWLDTSIGSQNGAQVEAWDARVIVNFNEGYVPTAGDRFTLSIGGNSLHGGSDAVLAIVPLPPALGLLAAGLGGLGCIRYRPSRVTAARA